MNYAEESIEIIERDQPVGDDIDMLTVRYRPAGEFSTGKVWTVIAHADGRDCIVTPDGDLFTSYFDMPEHVADFLEVLSNSGVL